MINLNELRDRAYNCACDHGFHDKDYSDEHFLMLTITELSEAVEADRKGKRADIDGFKSDNAFQSDHMPEAFVDNFEIYIKDTVEDELSDTVIRLLDLAVFLNMGVIISKKNICRCENLFRCKDFAAIIFEIITIMVIRTNHHHIEKAIGDTITALFGLAKYLDIELIWFIEQKIKYNELRPKMHGKKY